MRLSELLDTYLLPLILWRMLSRTLCVLSLNLLRTVAKTFVNLIRCSVSMMTMPTVAVVMRDLQLIAMRSPSHVTHQFLWILLNWNACEEKNKVSNQLVHWTELIKILVGLKSVAICFHYFTTQHKRYYQIKEIAHLLMQRGQMGKC